MKIAISGPSCSGKSTLTKALGNKFNALTFSLDDYWFNDPVRKFYIKTVGEPERIFELADEYNAELMLIQSLTFTDVFYEGFCLMAFPEIRKMVDWHFYVDVPWDILVSRRMARDGNDKASIGWKTIGKRGNELLTGFQRDLGKTTVLDGLLSTETLVEQISNKMLELSKR